MNKKELDILMTQIQDGSNTAFETLYNEMYRGVFSFIYSYTKNYHTAEDLLQETFIKVKTKIQNYNSGTNASAWILQIAKNTALDYLRKNKPVDETQETSNYFDLDQKLYLQNCLIKYIEDGDRQIIILHTFYGYKAREIAKILNIPMGTVLWKYNRAMKILKQKIKEDNYEK